MFIDSSAFPRDIRPTISSEVHEMFNKRIKKSNQQQPIEIRNWKSYDTYELRKLQAEWFPLTYPQSFYQKIEQGQSHCFIAETSIWIQNQQGETKRTIIVGAIVYSFTHSESQLQSTSWFKKIFSHTPDSIYIMTLGVINQFRNSGLAKKMLQEVFRVAELDSQIKFVYLHVVVYNERAIRFYLKNGFNVLHKYSDFYHIFGRQYEGLLVGIFVNGGQPQYDWFNCLRHLFSKST